MLLLTAREVRLWRNPTPAPELAAFGRPTAMPRGSSRRCAPTTLSAKPMKTKSAIMRASQLGANSAHQLLEEAFSAGPKLGEALLQQLAFVRVVPARGMGGQTALLSNCAGSKQVVAHDLLHVRTIHNQFVIGDPHRQQFSDTLPGHGIEVLQIGNVAIRVHGTV